MLELLVRQCFVNHTKFRFYPKENMRSLGGLKEWGDIQFTGPFWIEIDRMSRQRERTVPNRKKWRTPHNAALRRSWRRVCDVLDEDSAGFVKCCKNAGKVLPELVRIKTWAPTALTSEAQ